MKKRILSLVLAFVMVFSLAVPTFAAEANLEVDTLVALGMLEGSGAGITPEYLASEMTRLTAACSVLKLFGKYEEALKFQGTENFADAKDVKWVEGQNVLAYLKANPQFGFTGVTADKFDANAKIDQNSVVKVMLTNLGYVQDVDFAWADVATFAASKGMVIVEGAYNVDALAKNVFSALKVENKVTKTTIAQDLAKDPAKKAILVAAGLIEDEAVELEAVSAEFINLKQVKVVFNKTVDETDAEAVKNYTVKDENGTKVIGDADLQEDGKTVVLTLKNTETDINKETNKVKNGSTKNEVKVNVGKEVTFEKLKALDAEFPTVVGVKLTGPKALEVTFSEPVGKTGNPFTLADSQGKKIGISSSVSPSADLEVMTLTTLVELKDGEYTLTIDGSDKKVLDYAGYMITAQDVKFDAVKDTSAPVAEIVKVKTDATKDKETTTVTVKFNKTMKTTGTSVGSPISNLKAKLGYNATSNTGVEVKSTTKTNEYEMTFTDVVAPGTHNLYLVGGTTTSTKVKDTWGNVFEDASLTFEVVLDTEKPVVDSIVTEENNQFIVTFSEEVTTPKFIVKDADAKTVSGVTQAKDLKNDKKWNLTLKSGETFKGGVYTVEVKDAKDLSIFANKMDAVTVSVDTTDKVNPYIKSAAMVGKDVRVVFSEAMDTAVEEKANWSLTGATVKSVTLSDDAKSVIIATKDEKVASALQVVNAKDLAGNGLVTVKGETTSPVVVACEIAAKSSEFKATSVKLSAANEITITYEDNLVDGLDKDGIYKVTINGDSYQEFETTDVNVVDGTDTVVVLKLDNKATKNLTTTVDANGTSVISLEVLDGAVLTNQYDQTAFTGKASEITAVKDRAAAIMMGATAVADGNKVVVQFSERLYAGSVDNATFAIDGYTIDRVVVNVDGTVTLELDLDLEEGEGLAAGTELTVKLLGVVEDYVNRNATTETDEVDFTVGK